MMSLKPLNPNLEPTEVECPDALLELVADYHRDYTLEVRYQRLLTQLQQLIPCDAIAILVAHGEVCRPLVQQGLLPDIMGRRFILSEHPRLQEIVSRDSSTIFPSDCTLPDPYDGMLLGYQGNLPVHSCMGIPLHTDQGVLGLVTFDSMAISAFDRLSPQYLQLLQGLATAAMQLVRLGEQLQHSHSRAKQIALGLQQEPLVSDSEFSPQGQIPEMIGDSPKMLSLKQDVQVVAGSHYAVLIQGETGVGKELVARAIHRYSNRSSEPLVYINCAAIPETLFESELFGHVKGAFTSANRARLGKFALADGGTLFLDEVGELPLAVQSKLLRALQNQEIQAVGGDLVQQVDVRVIAATNRTLDKEVAEGRFRADLYHRLSVFPIAVPPLREREGDVTLLAGYFAEVTRRRLGLRQLVLSQAANHKLLSYLWPGNVRELEHVISRAALRAKADSVEAMVDTIVEITAGHIEALDNLDSGEVTPQSDEAVLSGPLPDNFKQATEAFQRQLLTQALRQHQGNWSAAARALAMDRSNLMRLAKRLNIEVIKQVSH